jgi:hypothetical protein
LLSQKDVILASSSSSDREFSAVELRRLLPKSANCHENIYVNGIHLLNSGFPVNFNGLKEVELPEDIQLTRSLMYAAVCSRIINHDKKGLIELNTDIQQKIISKFKELKNKVW